jgi:transglutaminase-like putative cysteine protease
VAAVVEGDAGGGAAGAGAHPSPVAHLDDGWRTAAKLETDFYNAFVDRPAPANPDLPEGPNNPAAPRDLVSNSRAALRVRQAYVRLDRNDWHLLLGQTRDVISPLFPSLNANVLMWNAGNPGDRRPQFRVGYEPNVGSGRWSFVGGVGAGGAVDGQDLDGDGFRDGEAAVTPTFQGRVGYSGPSHVPGRRWALGVYGHTARQQINRFRVGERIRGLAREIVGTERNPILAARAIYDWMLDFTDYWVKDPGNKAAPPVGSTDYCLNTGTGNCTDIHSLWASLARAAGIPTRIVYGSFFKKELDGTSVDQSYHCWIEFYAPEVGWIPHDVALAELFTEDIALTDANRTLVQRTTPAGYSGRDSAVVDYYFGNIEERRVTWSVGRDLVLTPPQDGGPVNAMAKAYVEIDGKPAQEGPEGHWVRSLTFVQVDGSSTSQRDAPSW